MFNFQNMNDYEFELLCKDLLEVELNKELRAYSKGRDGGIDISCFIMDDTIAQAKHYINSTYSNLLSSLKKEVVKVIALNPKNYYICTPLKLTPPNISEIYNLFKEYMDTPKNIYDGTRIDDLLSNEDYKDIIYKHYKLWLTSSNVLGLINNKDIFIDTDELMFSIKKDICLFVETQAYSDAIKILENENLIILLGDPGVGKTTISKMLLLYYSNLGYCVRYSSNNSIKDIKKTLSRNASKKEIILMDDFLGQHYLNLKEEQPNEMKTLITYILRSKNKKMILNSRITILNEALRRSFQLKDFLNDNDIKKYQIDLNKMPVFEKAKIFYNHIYFNNLPIEYFNEIKMARRYIKIIDHINYNPRIVEYVTKLRNYKQLTADQYYNYIIGKLDNPLDVWEDEFKNRMGNYDRIFMHTLYSLTDTFIDETILKSCFNKRIKYETGYDSTKDMFSECLSRLSESMVRIFEEKGQKKISVMNPSINDYIFHYLNNNDNEVDFILDYAVYIEQINRIEAIDETKVTQFILSKLKDDEFLLMNAIDKPIEYYYLEFIYKYDYMRLAIRDKIIDIISDPNTYNSVPRNITSKFLSELFLDHAIFEFYNFKELLFNFDNIKTVFNELIFEDINVFISIYKSYRNNEAENEEWIKYLDITLEGCIDTCIREEVESDIEANLYDIVYNAIDEADEEDKRNYFNGDESLLRTIVKNSVMTEIETVIDNKKNEIDNELFLIDELNIISEDIINQFDYYSQIDDYFRPDPDDDDHRDYSTGKNSYEEVHKIFDREYSV